RWPFSTAGPEPSISVVTLSSVTSPSPAVTTGFWNSAGSASGGSCANERVAVGSGDADACGSVAGLPSKTPKIHNSSTSTATPLSAVPALWRILLRRFARARFWAASLPSARRSAFGGRPRPERSFTGRAPPAARDRSLTVLLTYSLDSAWGGSAWAGPASAGPASAGPASAGLPRASCVDARSPDGWQGRMIPGDAWRRPPRHWEPGLRESMSYG